MLIPVDAVSATELVCFGASGTGETIAYDVVQQLGNQVAIVAYAQEYRPETNDLRGVPIIALDDIPAGSAVFVTVHDPAARRRIFALLAERNLQIVGVSGDSRLVHPSAEFGEGVIVSSTTRIGPDAKLGRGAIALSSIVAHDVTVGDFTTLAVGSSILGNVVIGGNVWIGAGAIIKNGTPARPLHIGDGAVVGVGAVVMSNVAAHATVIGNPAASIRASR